jgi:hypothetical protein
MTAALLLIVILIPVLLTMSIPTYREVRLLTVSGTLTEKEPVNYIHSERFTVKGIQLKTVLTLRANQQIVATIEVARIIGYYAHEFRHETNEVGMLGMYPEKVMNRTLWDFHHEYCKTIYASLKSVPADLRGKAPLGLIIEIFLEAPNFSSNPTFLVYWEITVYDIH